MVVWGGGVYKGEGCGRDSTGQEQNKPEYVRLNIAKAGGKGGRSKGSFLQSLGARSSLPIPGCSLWNRHEGPRVLLAAFFFFFP